MREVLPTQNLAHAAPDGLLLLVLVARLEDREVRHQVVGHGVVQQLQQMSRDQTVTAERQGMCIREVSHHWRKRERLSWRSLGVVRSVGRVDSGADLLEGGLREQELGSNETESVRAMRGGYAKV